MPDTNQTVPTCPLYSELLDVLYDIVTQCCHTENEGEYDSMAISAYADAMRTLARFGRLQIKADTFRRVLAVDTTDAKEAPAVPYREMQSKLERGERLTIKEAEELLKRIAEIAP